ncbi:YhjD/YihY/BrkB family envelope integrity protein [Paraburkholderia sp.]|uniref:YhjD/YihY/BrkB family envelope integrity protein n=1 Tax=Paraburkholderia sp. TaxID=1926495 RepID=UPI00239FB4F7|nr:YhjD/YihY/BrkB family envelope integrity protein [Paraburkholderia sp.]MDE1180102.1 YhjD/YihY/BrkB family envelope integrity protein [Paraburkholderia sp.]
MNIDTLSADKIEGVARKQASWAMGAFSKFSEDRCAAMAASIAFYAAFSLAPTLVMVIAVAGWFFGAEAARGELFDHIHGLLGNEAAAGVQTIVQNAHRSGDAGGIAAIISFTMLAIGASATFSSLNSALNMVWPVTGPRTSSVIALVRVRLISFGLVLGVAFLLIVSLVLDTAITFIGNMLWGDTQYVIIGNLLQLGVGLLVLACAFAALLKFLPDARVLWRDAMVGGIVAALLFSAGKKLFALYLAHAGMANSFGAAGSLAVLLMWLYFSAAVLLLGAEFSAARGRMHDPRGQWGMMQSDAPAGSRAKIASVLAASTMSNVGAPVQPRAASVTRLDNGATGTSPPAAADQPRHLSVAEIARAAFTGAVGTRSAPAVSPMPASRHAAAQASQAVRQAASMQASRTAKVIDIGRKVARVESQATHAAAVGLIAASRKATVADAYVKRHPWGSVLLAAGAALAVTAFAKRRPVNDEGKPSEAHSNGGLGSASHAGTADTGNDAA